MKTKFNFFLAAMLIAFLGCQPSVSLEDLKKFVATESHPDDVFLDSVSNKRAMIIVAHDDDDCAMSGTIAKLHAEGWEIKQFSLQNTPLREGRTTHPASIICDGNVEILSDGVFRNGLDTTKMPYMPIPKSDFENTFEVEKTSNAIIEKVNDFKPSAIFTLDSDIGGYGHPEHVFVSELVLDLAQSGKIQPKRIYQSVFTDHMEREIMDNLLEPNMKKWGYPSPYSTGKKVYGVSGMPLPNTQVKIDEYSAQKMEYLMAYHEKARKNMRKFIPYFDQFDHKTYFNLFDKEFFRMIEMEKKENMTAYVESNP